MFQRSCENYAFLILQYMHIDSNLTHSTLHVHKNLKVFSFYFEITLQKHFRNNRLFLLSFTSSGISWAHYICSSWFLEWMSRNPTLDPDCTLYKELAARSKRARYLLAILNSFKSTCKLLHKGADAAVVKHFTSRNAYTRITFSRGTCRKLRFVFSFKSA